MSVLHFPVIDVKATGENIARLRQRRGLSVRDLQSYFGFEAPQAIYQWQHGQSLPSVDNLFALSELLGVPMNEILVPEKHITHIASFERQAEACRSSVSCEKIYWAQGAWQNFKIAWTLIHRLFSHRQPMGYALKDTL